MSKLGKPRVLASEPKLLAALVQEKYVDNMTSHYTMAQIVQTMPDSYSSNVLSRAVA